MRLKAERSFRWKDACYDCSGARLQYRRGILYLLISLFVALSGSCSKSRTSVEKTSEPVPDLHPERPGAPAPGSLPQSNTASVAVPSTAEHDRVERSRQAFVRRLQETYDRQRLGVQVRLEENNLLFASDTFFGGPFERRVALNNLREEFGTDSNLCSISIWRFTAQSANSSSTVHLGCKEEPNGGQTLAEDREGLARDLQKQLNDEGSTVNVKVRNLTLVMSFPDFEKGKSSAVMKGQNQRWNDLCTAGFDAVSIEGPAGERSTRKLRCAPLKSAQ